MKTYKVLPLNERVGLIECVSDTCSYAEVAKPDRVTSVGGINSKDDFRSLAAKTSAESRAKDYATLSSREDNAKLKTSLVRMSNCPEGFCFLRDNFLRSHALHSAVGWIMSIGDRHAQNCLVSSVTGESIAIDFGYSFGATAFLPIPELVPFFLESILPPQQPMDV